MYEPDLLAIFRESYAAMYHLRIISCGYSCFVFTIIKIGL